MNGLTTLSLVLAAVSCTSANVFGNGFGGGIGGGFGGLGLGGGFGGFGGFDDFGAAGNLGFQDASALALSDKNAGQQDAVVNKASEVAERVAVQSNNQAAADVAESVDAGDRVAQNSGLAAANQYQDAFFNNVDGAANVNSASKTRLAFENANVYDDNAALSLSSGNAFNNANQVQAFDNFAKDSFLNSQFADRAYESLQDQLSVAALNNDAVQVGESLNDASETAIQAANQNQNFFGNQLFDSSVGFGGGFFKRK